MDEFTESRFLRPRRAQPQTYDFDFSAGEESDNDPERLALDDAESDTVSRQASMQPLPNLSYLDMPGMLQGPVDNDDDDDASAYLPSQPGSPVTTPSDQQTFPVYHPASTPSPQSSPRKTPKSRKAGYAEEEEDDDFEGRPSKAGPVRRKATGKGKKKSETDQRDTDHVKRPPNAFILYRSHACSNNLIPAELRINDHRQISRIVATMWRSLPAEERALWEGKAKEAKEKHNQEHPEYRYKPSSKPGGSQRKPRARKPPVADEDLTEEQLRERRRCEVVARVILQKEKESTPGPEVPDQTSRAATPGAPQPSGSPEPGADDIKARLAKEMKKAVEEDRARREFEDEQRRLGLMPPRPTEPIKARRQRAATVAPMQGRSRAPSAPPVLSPVRAASYDPSFEPSTYELQELLRPQHQHHRASSWSGVPGSEAFGTEIGENGFGAGDYQPDSSSYNGIEAQWDIRRPSVIFRDQLDLPFPGDEGRFAHNGEDRFDESAYVDQEGQVHSGLSAQHGVDVGDISMYQGESPTMPEHELYQGNTFAAAEHMYGRRDSTSHWFEQTTPTAPNHDWRQGVAV